MMDATLREYAERRFNELKSEGSLWTPVWKELRDLVQPTRGFFEGDKPGAPRKTDHKKVITSTAVLATRTAAAGLHSGLSSPARPWFRLVLDDPELSEFRTVRRYLDMVQSRVLAVYAQSNMYSMFPSMYAELVPFGTGACMIEEDFEHVLWGRSYTIGQYYFDVDHRGRVNTFAYEWDVTVDQLVSEFGLDNISSVAKTAYEEKKRMTVHVRMLIEPNPDAKADSLSKMHMPYRIMYWESNNDSIHGKTATLLRQGGFREFPVLGPRWLTITSSDVYGGACPGMEALGDIKSLYAERRDIMMGLKKTVDPPMVVDASLQGIANTLPGGLTKVNINSQKAGMVQAQSLNMNFQQLALEIEALKNDINRVFYVDLFRMLIDSDRREITAREVAEKHEEKLLQLGPVLDQFNQEMHRPLTMRAYNVMLRGGILPPPPKELQGQNFRVEYISILAQAQRMVATVGIEQGAAFVGSLAGAYPDVLDVLDSDAAAEEFLSSVGVPAKLIRSKEEVALKRQERLKALQQKEQEQAMMQGIQGAKLLSETDLASPNALQAIAGNIQPIPGGVPVQ